jgi:hypothetical protein
VKETGQSDFFLARSPLIDFPEGAVARSWLNGYQLDKAH